MRPLNRPLHRIAAIALLSTTTTLLPSSASAQPPTPANIEANVPPAADFDRLLQRDLTAYFRAKGKPSATSVQWTLLRQQPTQSGISYPKFYAWVRVLDGRRTIAQGALRIAAADGTHFEVRNFVSAADASFDADLVSRWFPASMVDDIVNRADAATSIPATP